MKPPLVTIGIAALTGGIHAWLASKPDAEFLRAVEGASSAPVSFVASPAVHLTGEHLALNLALLLGFGPWIERSLKGWGLALLYVASGAAGVGAHLLMSPATPLVGASGAVSGILGAHGTARPWGWASVGVAALWGLANLAGAALLRGSGVSYASHLGGWAAGALIGALISSRARKSRRAGP